MNTDSLILIVFYLISLLGCWWFIPHYRIEKYPVRKPIRWGKQIFLALLFLVGLAAMILSSVMWNLNDDQRFESVLYAVFSVSWLAMGWYLLPIRRSSIRICLAILFSVVFSIIVSRVKNQVVINLYTAWPLIWLGPLLFRRLRIPLLVFSAFLILFMSYDFYNILHTTLVEVSDSINPTTLDGLVHWGTSLIGAGDFLLSYLIITASDLFFGRRASLLICGLMTLSLVSITLLSQYSPGGLTLPFTVFIVPVALLEYFVLGKINPPRATILPSTSASNINPTHVKKHAP
jgi:hypothetical protein